MLQIAQKGMRGKIGIGDVGMDMLDQADVGLADFR